MPRVGRLLASRSAHVQANHLKRRAWRVVYMMRRPQAELPRVAQVLLACLEDVSGQPSGEAESGA